MSEFDPRFDPAFQRGYDAPEQALPPRPAQARPASPAALAAEVETGALAEEPSVTGVNPFLIALGALSVAMITAGVVLTLRLGDIFNSTQFNYEVDYVKLQIVMIGTPILIGLGLATGLGVLFVFAVRWRR